MITQDILNKLMNYYPDKRFKKQYIPNRYMDKQVFKDLINEIKELINE